MGYGEPHAFAICLALGELISFLRLGYFKYLQRQGPCCFSLVQHKEVGGLEEVMALAHALSSITLQVTPIAISAVSARSKVMSIMHTVVAHETFILKEKNRERLKFLNGETLGYSTLHQEMTLQYL